MSDFCKLYRTIFVLYQTFLATYQTFFTQYQTFFIIYQTFSQIRHKQTIFHSKKPQKNANSRRWRFSTYLYDHLELAVFNRFR
jgi:hypothetical protein